MRSYLVFLLLVLVKVFSRLFYRVDMQWIGDPPADRWRHIRLLVVLNHTSLYEPLFTGGVPLSFLWRIARHGVVPIAQKTAVRPLIGHFYKLIAARVISITRERDESWDKVLAHVDPDAMVALLPEGRMKRSTGLDAAGQRMTVRGGIADLLQALGAGRMLLAYSGGLHHVQAPGERFPRPWKTIRMRLELVDIASYRAALLARAGAAGFKRAVIEDLERRRDLLCPCDPRPAA
ncbi:MAG TPA: 1-acyl-sn-glycerol-3-phosphate acyltransferase [Thermoanaerobaculia bacterium]|nr:1-acyl-sn-glycerol-3-phosphate acyltransferase [Thermoanaerobaculia bacterium]